MTAELPKQELLLKLLKMTTSSHDGEALAAVRRANSLLSSAGWDWDRLLAGKIVVVADPFSSIPTPDQYAKPTTSPQAPKPPRAPQPPPRQPPTPPPPHPQARTQPPPPKAARPNARPISTMPNKYPNGCWCCGDTVDAGLGFAFKPADVNIHLTPNPQSTSKWQVICCNCNTFNSPSMIPPHAARRTRKPAAIPPNAQPSTSQL
jgi:hypothetical protein